MKFILNCQEVDKVSAAIGEESKKLSNATSYLSVPNGDGDFDWSGAINSITTNITNTSERMQNAEKYIQMVVERHKELQTNFDYETIKAEADDKLTKIGEVDKVIPVPTDPTIETHEVVPPQNAAETTTKTTPSVTSTSDYTAPDGSKHFTIPEGNGVQYTYMGWQAVTAPDSNQYKLREAAGMNFDEEGFGKIDDRYVIACTTTFGQVGEYVDFKLEDGTILKCIIGDSKGGVNPSEGVSEWGHNNGKNVVEFVVDKNSWYGKKDNPGTSSNHPEWNHRVVEANVYGNYFTDRRV